jgi:hypothetical protein
VDSLYLSFTGKLSDDIERTLSQLKECAQSAEPSERARAQWKFDAHIFEVQDKGRRNFAFVLEDGSFRIELSKRTAGSQLPMAYVRVSSHYLCSASPQQAVADLRAMLGSLGHIDIEPTVSRLDLFADFASHHNMEWTRSAWITRAKRVNQYVEGERFTGWGIGYGGPLTARLYDKNHEIERSGKQYLRTLWDQMGWNDSDPVWRLEFQFSVDVFRRFNLRGFSQVIEQLNGLWCYAMDDWLRLALPNPEDATRSRWPIHPLWTELSSIDFGGPEMPRLRKVVSNRAPNEGRVLRRGFGVLATFMALRQIEDYYEGCVEMAKAIRDRINSDGFFEGASLETMLRERIALRVREYNLALNAQEGRERLNADARAYRDASGG